MKIAYIDYSFHKKTGSTLFFQEILRHGNNVHTFWDDYLNDVRNLKYKEINEQKFDLIVFFQIIPPFNFIKKLDCKNIIWVPMHDSERKTNFFEWLKYFSLNIKIISFSSTLSKKLKYIGFCKLDVKYYPPISLINNINFKKIKLFFWQRNNDITWDKLKKILPLENIEQVILKASPDPSYKLLLPSKEDCDNHNIKIIDGWISKEDYNFFLKDSNLYIASRCYEGIGMGFLEAMSRGIPVLAPNYPTMNEYIDDGKNGFLYNPKKLQKKDFKDISNISKTIIRDMQKGFDKWNIQKKEIEQFVKKSPKVDNLNHGILLHIIIRVYELIIKPFEYLKNLIKKIRENLNNNTNI
ncbi:MAG: glycosyltransferase [Candidatus Shapirobacteria bacterium]|nr:glycosyltransferase [Candidatus Shapirobacteria bacterium]